METLFSSNKCADSQHDRASCDLQKKYKCNNIGFSFSQGFSITTAEWPPHPELWSLWNAPGSSLLPLAVGRLPSLSKHPPLLPLHPPDLQHHHPPQVSNVRTTRLFYSFFFFLHQLHLRFLQAVLLQFRTSWTKTLSRLVVFPHLDLICFPN